MFVTLPYKEIIFGLRGYSGSFFLLDELEYENNLDRKLFQDCFGESNLENLKRLCALAVQHKIILDYDQDRILIACDYERSFIDGIRSSLTEYYDELNHLEERKDNYITLCAFHSLFKITVTQLFDILVTKLKSPVPLFRKFYQIIFSHYKKAFYEKLWNWLIHGYLDKIQNKFFIQSSQDKEEIFKFKEGDLPSLDQSLLKRILMHGKLIYLFESNYKITWRDIFFSSLDQLSTEFLNLCSAEEYHEVQLVNFINNTIGVLLKFYSAHLIEKQDILSHLNLIKETHLMGNHSFWMEFCSDLVKRMDIKQFNKETDLSLKDVKNSWLKNIREFYGEEQVDRFQQQVNIHKVEYRSEKVLDKHNKLLQSKVFFFPEISISYNFPAMIRLFLCKETFEKYDVLFNFLLKLHQTRMVLNKLWFENMKNDVYDKRICIITMKLTSLIEKFLFHYKVYIIEIAYREFEHEVKNYNDPTELEQCHTKFINRLLKESLVNIDGVRNQFLDLFAFCQRVYLTSQREITTKEYFDLQLDLNDLNSHFSLLFSNVKAHEKSSSLRYLLN